MIENESVKGLLPDYYRGVHEIQKLAEVQDKQNDLIVSAVKRVRDNFYISTAHDEVLSFYESFYGINISSNDDLATRRFRVLTRIISQPPFTPVYLADRLRMLGGEAQVIERPQSYEVLVVTSLSKKGQVEELPFLLKTMVPSNMVVISKNILNNESKGIQKVGGVARSWSTITTR